MATWSFYSDRQGQQSRWRWCGGMLVSGIFLVMWLALAWQGQQPWLMQIDQWGMQWVQWREGAIATLAWHFSLTIDWLGRAAVSIALSLLLGLWFAKQQRGLWWAPPVLLGSGWLINFLLKVAFDRPRPTLEVAISTSGSAFPSGHATATTLLLALLAYGLWPLLPRWLRLPVMLLLLILVVLAALTRPLLGVHYISDVVAGMALAMSCFAGFLLLAPVARRRRLFS
ncbi:phosphatase PAP2 family protein [Aquaspirillum soli]